MPLSDLLKSVEGVMSDLAKKKQALDDATAKVTSASAEYQTAVDGARKLRQELDSEMGALMPGVPTPNRVRVV